MKIELNGEMVEEIMKEELSGGIEMLQEDLRKIANGHAVNSFVYGNNEEDKRLIELKLASYKDVLADYVTCR
jgi:hypothetical protein